MKTLKKFLVVSFFTMFCHFGFSCFNISNVNANFKREIPLFMSTDDNYTFATVVSITSALKNANPNTFYKIHVLVPEGNFKSCNRSKIKQVQELYSKNCEIVIVDMKDDFDSIPKTDGYSSPAYYRLKIHEIFPGLNKGIYVDVDTVILEDLTQLLDWDMHDYLIAGVPDGQRLNNYENYKKYLGIDGMQNYINSGVMVMQLNGLRESGISEKFNEFIEGKSKLGGIPFVDQSVINSALYGKITDLPLKFNTQTYLPLGKPNEALGYFNIFGEENWMEAVESPAIIHYAGAEKPWNFREGPSFNEWWKYAKDSNVWDEIVQKCLPQLGFENEQDLFLFFKIQDDEEIEKQKKVNEQVEVGDFQNDLKVDDEILQTEPEQTEKSPVEDPQNQPGTGEEILKAEFKYIENDQKKDHEEAFALELREGINEDEVLPGVDKNSPRLQNSNFAEHRYKEEPQKNRESSHTLKNLFPFLIICGFSLIGAVFYLAIKLLGRKVLIK
ncbi:MAG: glycosyltransferase family 8 protein [Oscillospiraceae bacterium]|nr:glycosyltransferase family 8 protein [Oscillospiraceae bacterium]